LFQQVDDKQVHPEIMGCPYIEILTDQI